MVFGHVFHPWPSQWCRTVFCPNSLFPTSFPLISIGCLSLCSLIFVYTWSHHCHNSTHNKGLGSIHMCTYVSRGGDCCQNRSNPDHTITHLVQKDMGDMDSFIQKDGCFLDP